jgi:hypothetical protein
MKAIGKEVVLLVVAVIIGAFSIWFIISQGTNAYRKLLKMMGIAKVSNVEQAIICAIYRCAYGCHSVNIKDIEWRSGDKKVKCMDVCVGDRVCDSSQPIILNLNEMESVLKDNLFDIKIGNKKGVDCLLYNSSMLKEIIAKMSDSPSPLGIWYNYIYVNFDEKITYNYFYQGDCFLPISPYHGTGVPLGADLTEIVLNSSTIEINLITKTQGSVKYYLVDVS